MRVIIHRHAHRVADAAAKDMVKDLVERLWRAAQDFKARVTVDAWEESKHPRAPDGRFGNKAGEHGRKEEPSTAAAGPQEGKSKQRMYDLLKTGQAFTKKDLAELLGIPETRVTSFLTFFKNPKYAGAGREALNIVKSADGKYQVLDASGKLPEGVAKPKPTPAPTPPKKEASAPPSPPPAPPAPKPEPKADPEGDAKYNEYQQAVVDHEKAYEEMKKRAGKLGIWSEAKAVRTYASAIRNLKYDIQDAQKGMNVGLDASKAAVTNAGIRAEKFFKDDAANQERLKVDNKKWDDLAAKAKEWKPSAHASNVGPQLTRLGLAKHADFSSITVTQANAYAESLANHIAEFPRLSERMDFYGGFDRFHQLKKEELGEQLRNRMSYGNHYTKEQIDAKVKEAQTEYDRTAWNHGDAGWAASHAGFGGKYGNAVTVNEKYSRSPGANLDLQAGLKRGVESGFHPPGCDTVKSIADHELGHKLDEMLRITRGATAEVKKRFNDIMASANHGLKTSRYAATNPQEFLAEAWAESINSPNPREPAKQIAELIRSAYASAYPQARKP